MVAELPLRGRHEAATPDSWSPSTTFINHGPFDMSADGKRIGVLSGYGTASPLYTLADGFDGAAWKNGLSYNVGAYDTMNYGISMKDDGTAFVTVGDTNNYLIYRNSNTIETWQSGSGGTQSIATQNPNPRGVAVSEDGTHIYIGENSTPAIKQYDATNIWTGSAGFAYANKSLDISAKVSAPVEISLSSDGTEIYVSEWKTLHQYHMSTAWDVSTGSWVRSMSFDHGSISTAIMVTDSIMAIGGIGDMIHMYYLSTAKDISTATGVNASYLTSSTSAYYFYIDESETHLYVPNSTEVHQYTLDSPGAVSEGHITYDGLFDPAESGSPRCVFVKPDGTKMYLSMSFAYVYQYTLSPAWDVTSAVYDSKSKGTTNVPTQIAWSHDGTKFYYYDGSTRYWHVATAGTPWDLGTVGTFTNGHYIGTVKGLSYTADGLHLVHTDSNDVVDYVNLGGAFTADPDLVDTSTADAGGLVDYAGLLDWMQVSPDGEWLYLLNGANFTKVSATPPSSAAGGAGWGMLPVGA